MIYSIDTIKSKSKDIMEKARKEYQAFRDLDKENEAKRLKPGEKMSFPNYNGFFSSEMRDKCDDRLKDYRAEIEKMLNDVSEEIKKKSAEPPTADQANLVTILSIGKPEKEELQNALEQNINNYATYSAITRIAAENNIHLDVKNPLENLIITQGNLKGNMDNLNTRNAETRLTGAFMEFSDLFDTMI